MYPYIKCPTCNNELASVYRVFQEMRKMVVVDHDQYSTEFTTKNSLLETFELLKIKNVCCRSHINTVREFNPFLHSDSY
jgi:DNA-directed RNA polymerase subunit N (RpoN/RPB10)